MIIAFQRPLGNLAEEREVRFGRERYSISVAVIEDDRGYRIESRCGRKLVTGIDIGGRDSGFNIRLCEAIACATAEAQARLLEML